MNKSKIFYLNGKDWVLNEKQAHQVEEQLEAGKKIIRIDDEAYGEKCVRYINFDSIKSVIIYK